MVAVGLNRSCLVDQILGLHVLLASGLAPSSLDLGSGLGEDSFFGVVHFAEFVEVDVGPLDDFDLSDLDVLDGVDGGDLLGDFLLDDLAGEQIEDLGGVGLGHLLGHDVVDSLSDQLLLRGEGVVGLPLLVG